MDVSNECEPGDFMDVSQDDAHNHSESDNIAEHFSNLNISDVYLDNPDSDVELEARISPLDDDMDLDYESFELGFARFQGSQRVAFTADICDNE